MCAVLRSFSTLIKLQWSGGGDAISDPFHMFNGFRQGGILSTFLMYI